MVLGEFSYIIYIMLKAKHNQNLNDLYSKKKKSKLFFNYYLIFALNVQFNFLNFGVSPLIIHGTKAKLITSLV